MGGTVTTKRPTCGHCGKPYGQRATTLETVRWECGEPMPAYRGNGIVVKTGNPYTTTNRATVRKLTMLSVNASIRSFQEEELAKLPEKSQQTATREIWDGQSWRGGYSPFCTLRCALAYARHAYARSAKG